MKHLRFLMLGLATSMACAGADLRATPEYVRPNPFGGIVDSDRHGISGFIRGQVTLESARAAYVSCHLVAVVAEGGEYGLEVNPFPAATGIRLDLYREWFHFLPASNRYIPDALIPVRSPYASRLPEADNHIPGQTAQAFWLDIWVPASTQPGEYATSAVLKTGSRTMPLPIKLTVLSQVVPDTDAVAIDHNTYGTSWFDEQYPNLARRYGQDFSTSDAFYKLIHAYHRVFYEHRGVFHQLGYGHAGKVGPEFAPQLEGSGRSKHVSSWEAFDRHYGPLLDGSAFAQTRRGAKPIPFAYLPINPEWPASYLGWGEPGYEREFVNVVSEMERHFREKGWTSTRFELFFNHKKRYKGFEWDGDETRFAGDYAYFREYARLLKAAVPADTPVKFVFRADVSWTMEKQFKELAGIINFWTCGGGMFGWYDYAPRMLKERGDIVWIYGGTPAVTEPLSAMAVDVLRPWLWGIDGFVRWLTTSPGPDPWNKFEGGTETLVYPGEPFGVEAPLASVRLKVERNAVQDLTLLNDLARVRPLEKLKVDAAKAFNDTSVEDWRTPRPPLADGNPEDWSNTDVDEVIPKNRKFTTALQPAAWQHVREYMLELAREAK